MERGCLTRSGWKDERGWNDSDVGWSGSVLRLGQPRSANSGNASTGQHKFLE